MWALNPPPLGEGDRDAVEGAFRHTGLKRRHPHLNPSPQGGGAPMKRIRPCPAYSSPTS